MDPVHDTSGRQGIRSLAPSPASLLLVAAAGALAALALALGLGEREPLELRVARITGDASAAAGPEADPFAWRSSRQRRVRGRARRPAPRT